ncbi:MAG: SlyX family protein [Rhizobiales bacterium]|nr:SlyX family protein [Hyphomicrobiales bacterium]
MPKNNNENIESRLAELEMLNTHQAQTIDELSLMVSKQWDKIDVLETKMSALVTRFLSLEENAGPAHENTKPPHY